MRNSDDVEVFRGVTPTIVRIPPSGHYFVSVSLPGYKEQSPFALNLDEKKKEEEKEEEEKEKEEEEEEESESDWSLDLCGGNACDTRECDSNPFGSNACDLNDCDTSGCDLGDCNLSSIGKGGFGVKRLVSPMRDLSPGHIAINLVTALSDQNINEAYVVFHTRHDGHLRTMTVPFIRQ